MDCSVFIVNSSICAAQSYCAQYSKANNYIIELFHIMSSTCTEKNNDLVPFNHLIPQTSLSPSVARFTTISKGKHVFCGVMLTRHESASETPTGYGAANIKFGINNKIAAYKLLHVYHANKHVNNVIPYSFVGLKHLCTSYPDPHLKSSMERKIQVTTRNGMDHNDGEIILGPGSSMDQIQAFLQSGVLVRLEVDASPSKEEGSVLLLVPVNGLSEGVYVCQLGVEKRYLTVLNTQDESKCGLTYDFHLFREFQVYYFRGFDETVILPVLPDLRKFPSVLWKTTSD